MPFRLRRHAILSLVTTLVLPITSAVAQSGTVPVPGAGNLFAAGGNAGVGDGIDPVMIALNPGASRQLQFTSVTGTWHWVNETLVSGPDGMTYHSETNVTSLNSIAGIRAPWAFWLAGVFLDDGLPSSAPPRLDYFASNISESQLLFGPFQLGQTFFIGDGLGQGGATQTWIVPTGATRLFLGTIDAGGFNGPPGAYGDNSGSISVSYAMTPYSGPVTPPTTATPEPTTVALTAIGMFGLCAVARRRRKSA
jgi:hypothetical protein